MKRVIVVSVAANGVIGRDGDLPWPPTGDLVQFKQLTLGHPLIMGRSTFESIGRPLPGRTSIVLSRQPECCSADDAVLVAHDFAEAFELARRISDRVFIIGGAEVYQQAREQDLVDEMVVTHLEFEAEGDVTFDPVEDDLWQVDDVDKHQNYRIVTYSRRESVSDADVQRVVDDERVGSR